MKIRGRNIKLRLYGLRNIPTNIKRARYFRGHGVHSPFVYAIVRQVFMCSKLYQGSATDLYDALMARGVAKRRAIQLQNLVNHCRYESFAIDCSLVQMAEVDMVIATTAVCPTELIKMAAKACEAKCTLCIMSPSRDKERDMACREIVEAHKCTSVDNRGYLLVFNNHLPKQKFRL
ncbi:MAG: hypothetical protein IKU88_09030 [Alistipes sp.]|nr:hypothetical protein [Alistipes sp.]